MTLFLRKCRSLALFLLFLFAIPLLSAREGHIPLSKADAGTIKPMPVPAVDSLAINDYLLAGMYVGLELEVTGLSQQAFDNAIKGYSYYKDHGMLTNENILTIIDFSLPSDKPRIFVLDVKNFKLLFKTFVAHGRNSGAKYARHFSNRPGSYMSSLGFYVTGSTYFGEHGYSLKLRGEEQGINDNAYRRAIVMHSAYYVSKSFIHHRGYIGRSLGCPALPVNLSRSIIKTIKDGTCLFIYAPSQNYVERSRVI